MCRRAACACCANTDTKTVLSWISNQCARLLNCLMAAEDCSQMWHDLACRVQDDIDPPAHVGITTDGSLVLMRHEAQVSA